MNNIYLATKLICDTYEQQVKGVSEEVENWLVHKIKHTFQVCSEIMNIFYHEKEIYNTFSEKDKELVELSAILHDLGRFYQHTKDIFLPSHEFEHGAAAVNLLKKHPIFNDPILLFAIGEHNHYQIDYQNPYYLQLMDDDKKKADIIAKLLRDADKLDNIRHTIYSNACYKGKDIDRSPLSDEVKECLKRYQPICYINSKIKFDDYTAAEKFLGHLSWVNDIYFDYTKAVIREIGLIDFALNRLKDFDVSDEDIAFLQKYLVI